MVNLSPIAEMSCQCLKTGGYRDFLNIPSSNKSPIEPHCWHLFVPKYLGQDHAIVPGDYLDTIDFEDPTRDDHQPEYELDYIPKIFNIDVDVFNVTETNINLSDRLDLSTIRAVRDADGKPVDYNSLDETILNISKNVTVDAKISRLKEFMEQYGDEDVEFMEVLDDDDVPLHDRITVHMGDDQDPGANSIDVEIDGDVTIISAGGAIDNLLIYDQEGNITVCPKDAYRHRTNVRSTHWMGFAPAEFAKLTSTIEGIDQDYEADSTLPMPIKQYEPEDPLRVTLFKTPKKLDTPRASRKETPRTPRKVLKTPRRPDTPGTLKETPRTPRKVVKATPQDTVKRPLSRRTSQIRSKKVKLEDVPSTSRGKGKCIVTPMGRVITPKAVTPKKSDTPRARGRGQKGGVGAESLFARPRCRNVVKFTLGPKKGWKLGVRGPKGCRVDPKRLLRSHIKKSGRKMALLHNIRLNHLNLDLVEIQVPKLLGEGEEGDL